MWKKCMKSRAAWFAMILGIVLSGPLQAAEKDDAAKKNGSWLQMSLEEKETARTPASVAMTRRTNIRYFRFS
jgi:hypothetical protein